MGLFKKTQRTEPLPETEETPIATSSEALPQNPLSIEEVAHKWWAKKFDMPLPDEVKSWMKQLVRAEARRLNLTGLRLTEQQERHATETKNLALVKLESLEQMMEKVRTQLEWLHNYQRLKQGLKLHTEHLYEANKQLAANEYIAKELERYETFETIRGLYQQLRLLEQMGRENKESQTLLARRLETAQRDMQDTQREMAYKSDRLNESQKRIAQAFERIEIRHRLRGEQHILDLDLKGLQEGIERMQQQKKTLNTETRELQTEVQRLQDLVAHLGVEKQAMLPHQGMLEQGSLALLSIEILSEAHKEMEETRIKYNEALRRQRESNHLQEQVYAQYQRLETDIQTLRSEMLRHRQSITSNTSYALQERAMKLKIRYQMLLTAQNLWTRIRQNYEESEERALSETQLRLHISNLQQDIDTRSKEVSTLQRVYKDKEHTLTLSKSQNVIQLRSSLRERLNGTICGTTHHPYHSDAMQEQNLLINQMQTECESMQAELTAKEKHLMQLHNELASSKAHHEAQTAYLLLLRTLQASNVKEWGTYAVLDRSFAECSPTTNRELRSSMIRQLIENTIHDAEQAQRELDTHNYHQKRINEISDILAEKERTKNDLALRMNELNTACQVLAHQEEQLQKAYSTIRDRYTHHYEETNKIITLNDWFKLWQSNPKSLQLRISELVQRWDNLNANRARAQKELEVTTATLEGNRKREALLEATIQWAQDNREQRKRMRNETEHQSNHALDGQSLKDYEETQRQAHEEAILAYRLQQEVHQKASLAQALLEGHFKELQDQGRHIDEETATKRSALDIWIRQYNTNHPPVQYAELERAFSGETDWNDVRRKIRQTHIEAIVEQALVDSLRSDILYMQSTSLQPATGSNEPTREGLITQLSQLEQQYREVSLQIAEQETLLRRNALYKARLMAEDEAFQDLANK